MSTAKFREVTLEDIAADPNKFGAPTFEQYCANPGKWKLADDQTFKSISAGSQSMKNVRKHILEVQSPNGRIYPVKSEEEAERVCREEGIQMREVEFAAFKIPVERGQVDVHIRLRKKNNAR